MKSNLTATVSELIAEVAATADAVQRLLIQREQLWQQRCYKVMLLTGSTNPATLKFYREVGFEQNKTGFQIRQVPVRES